MHIKYGTNIQHMAQMLTANSLLLYKWSLSLSHLTFKRDST